LCKAGYACVYTANGRDLLLVNAWLQDLGEFTFKGIRGSHSLVSVCTKALAGRSFPTALRKAKGTQLTRGQGLLYQLQMQAAAERAQNLSSPSYGRQQQQQQQQQVDFGIQGAGVGAAGAVFAAAAEGGDMYCSESGSCAPVLQLQRADELAAQAALPVGRVAAMLTAEAALAAATAAAVRASSGSSNSAHAAAAEDVAFAEGASNSNSIAVDIDDSSRAGATLQLSAAPSLAAPCPLLNLPQQP
jgi:hypothetical protein